MLNPHLNCILLVGTPLNKKTLPILHVTTFCYVSYDTQKISTTTSLLRLIPFYIEPKICQTLSWTRFFLKQQSKNIFLCVFVFVSFSIISTHMPNEKKKLSVTWVKDWRKQVCHKCYCFSKNIQTKLFFQAFHNF